jgi:hypothetical protein
MKRFREVQEPATFDARCRQRGQVWLAQNQGYDRPRDYWTEFEPDLRKVFRGLCAYCVMLVMKAEIDHFVPVAILKQHGDDNQAYEWANFRYGDKTLNGRKWKHLILDPYKVQDNWFELRLPSLQLVLTDKVPQKHRQLAEFTLKQLGLTADEVIVRYRQQWFEMYRKGQLSLTGLAKVAPLIARAVRRDLRASIDWARKQ